MNKIKNIIGSQKHKLLKKIDFKSAALSDENHCNSKVLSLGISVVSLSVIFIIIFVVYKTFINPKDFDIPEDDDDLSARRQMNRGMIASLITAITFGSMNTIVNATCDINFPTSTALLNLLLGNTIGFLMDNSMGTNDGLKNFQKNG